MRNPLSIPVFVFLAGVCGGLFLNACVATNKAEGEETATAAQQLQACETCMGGQCASAYHACFDDPACHETFTCAQKCRSDDKQCVWKCIEARPATADRFMTLGWCGANPPCQDTCILPRAVIDECPVCSAKFCPQQFNTCFGNPECWDLVSCVRNRCNPGDLECAQECIGDHPGGLAEIQGLRECSSQHCVEDCSRRQNATPN